MQDAVDVRLKQWSVVRPDLDVSAMGVIGRLSRLTRLLELSLQEVFDAHGLQPGEFDLLATLRRADPESTGLTAVALARAAMRTSGAITNRLDRLVAKDLVRRDVDEANRRAILVTLTPKGRTVLDAALADHVANEERLLAALEASEREQLASLLRTLLLAHGDEAPPA
ncbi:MarR family winged helix-turn-helix transcriptional regulator [Occultella aeris]|uniref:HTH-type transcriptional regulator MhqR n=1 Tax=Occultella aeris TaxID=2761496 RepID=A0A7M4DMT7_9MICO|nr:MarR family transcriptional regulator [Occultella aeris]VZO38732.1 HTH-type transcriptional regulator MhqR [Occultella aeris]